MRTCPVQMTAADSAARISSPTAVEEELGNEQSECRGKVHHIGTGAVHYVRGLMTLGTTVAEMLPDAEAIHDRDTP